MEGNGRRRNLLGLIVRLIEHRPTLYHFLWLLPEPSLTSFEVGEGSPFLPGRRGVPSALQEAVLG